MSYPRSVRRFLCLGLLAGIVALSPTARAQWIEFVDVTASALDAEPSLVAEDPQEKDYAWGDVDNDGDIDLVVVRKEPFTSFGKEPNVLLINQDGVLTDRTADFASDSDIVGDNGFLTPTNDRDVVLVDVDLDGWLDIVTSPTLSDDDPKSIGHPRIYWNRGCTGPCATTEDWQGFVYEGARIPKMLSYEGEDLGNPRFCAVSAGDVTGDGYPDLYFSDYDWGVIGDPIPGPDFNDKLLINLGEANPGFFIDVTDERFSGMVPGIFVPLVVSHFGAANVVVDLNGDDLAEIVKHTALEVPYYVGIGFNSPGSPGFFDTYSVVNEGVPYFVSAGDLNNDDFPELILTDDGADRYYINQGGAATEFISYPFSFSHNGEGGLAGDDGFGSNSLAVDVDNDGWNDVLIADVDVDVPGCNRRMHIYRNLGGTPGQVPTIEEQSSGSGCANFFGNPPTCIVAGIPVDKLVGTHDMAVFDINGDGWKDLVVGRCSGTEVYTQIPSGPPVGATPDGTDVPGQQLIVGKSLLAGHITLSWGESCSLDDDDYAVYAGQLGNIGGQSPVACSTLGAAIHTFLPDPEDSYYLVVPNNGNAEGSYGQDSVGVPRQRGPDACYPQSAGACD
jgi:hypothetical protein